MPTPDEENLNPITDLLETPEQKEKRLKHEQGMRELIAKLPEREPVHSITK